MTAHNINWDVDSEEEREYLPDSIKLPDGLTNKENISDYITDVTGFCHKGFELSES